MEDKNGQRIWDGDYVVGITASGDVAEGVVTGKDPAHMIVRIMDPDTGKFSWLKNYRLEVQPVSESQI